jgi:hypothetical protein
VTDLHALLRLEQNAVEASRRNVATVRPADEAVGSTGTVVIDHIFAVSFDASGDAHRPTTPKHTTLIGQRRTIGANEIEAETST